MSSEHKIIVWRVRVVQILLSVSLLVIMGYTLKLQYQGKSQTEKVKKALRPHAHGRILLRGSITDSTGKMLARDIITNNIFLNPKNYEATRRAEEDLIEILNLNTKDFDRRIDAGYNFLLAKNLGTEAIKAIKDLKIKGLRIQPTNQREYPQGKLASHILGYVNWQESGETGIESTADEYLNTEKDSTKYRSDGQPVYHTAPLRPVMMSAIGQQIELTINLKLQYKIEKIMAKYIEKYNPKKATIIALKTKTGEILGWANYPNYDPNAFGQYSYESMNNWAITHRYEPGSTFKVLTVTAALESNVVDEDTFTYLDTGEREINGRTIKNHDKGEREEAEINLIQLLQYSSNTGSSELALLMGQKKFHKLLKKFQIGKTTGIDLPGEVSGTLYDPEHWSEIDIATTSFGQGKVSVTPIQLLSSINAIANKGLWVQPHVIKSIQSSDGKKTLKETKRKRKRIVSRSTANTVNKLLAQSQENNLQDKGYIPGQGLKYKIIGKTGTAQKYCPHLRRYCPYATIASYIGYLPAERPLYTILVIFDSAKYGGGWGNVVAGPPFNETAAALIEELQGEIEYELNK